MGRSVKRASMSISASPDDKIVGYPDHLNIHQKRQYWVLSRLLQKDQMLKASESTKDL